MAAGPLEQEEVSLDLFSPDLNRWTSGDRRLYYYSRVYYTTRNWGVCPLTKTPLLLTMGILHFNLYWWTRAWWQAPLITNAATCIILPGIEESVPLQKNTYVDHGYTTFQFILMDQWRQAPLLLQQRVLHYQELRSLLPYKKTLMLTMGILHFNLYWWTSGDRRLY